MASGKIPATVIIVTLTLLMCFTTAWGRHHTEHLAPETAPASSPDYVPVPLSGSVIIGDSEPSSSPSMYEKKMVASNNCGGNGGSTWGGYGGQNYGGGMGGSTTERGGMSGMTGTGGMTYSGGGLQRSAAGIASFFVGHVPFSVVLLVTGLMYL